MSTTKTVPTKEEHIEKNRPTPVPSAPLSKTLHIKTDDETLGKMSLPELERTASLARARYLYAAEQKTYWDSELYWRSFEFNRTIEVYEKRRHGFTDEMIAAPSKRGEVYLENDV